MVITYYGVGCFKVQLGDITVALGPIGKESKHKQARFGSNIALVPLMHPDFSGTDSVSRTDKQPFEIRGSGEYEVTGVFIKGIEVPSEYQDVVRRATAYTIRIDDIDILYLGAMTGGEIKPATWEQIGNVDILLAPIGEDEGFLSPKAAQKLAVSLSANITIPYGLNAASVKEFIEEDSDGQVENLDKLTIKSRDLNDREGDIVVLNNQA